MSSYIRSTNGALINTDDSYYRSIVAQRETEKLNQRLTDELNQLKSELGPIKQMLQQIATKDNNVSSSS